MLLLLERILAAASTPSESGFVHCIVILSRSIFLELGLSESFNSICVNMSIVGGGGYSAGRGGRSREGGWGRGEMGTAAGTDSTLPSHLSSDWVD